MRQVPVPGSAKAPVHDDGPDVEVRFEDQQNINEFGRLNNRFIELDEDLQMLKVRVHVLLVGVRRRCDGQRAPTPFHHAVRPIHPPIPFHPPQEQLEKLDDALTELMVGMGGPVRLMLGEAFVEVSEDYATEYCEKKQEQLQARVEELGTEKDAIATRQQELKKALYGRFGNSINLES